MLLSAGMNTTTEYQNLKQCRDCELYLPETVFCKDARQLDGFRPYCKECVAVRRHVAHERSKVRFRNGLPKVCSRCNTLKPTSEFYAATGNKDGLASWCKRCTVEKFHTGFNHTSRKAQLKYCYGITTVQYDAMLTQQDGVCAICENPDTVRLAVDHCHKTGEVRGLLCGKCNKALGLLHDDVALLAKALAYLTQAKSTTVYADET